MAEERDESFSLTAWRANRARFLDRELGRTPGQVRFALWVWLAGFGFVMLKVGAPIYALIAGHWPYAVVLAGAACFDPGWVRGFVIVGHLLKVAAVVVGFALGLWKLAVLGVVVPGLLGLILAMVGPRVGVRRRWDFLRMEASKPLEQERRETRRMMMSRWSESLRAAPADRESVERVLLDMRWCSLTPEQATILARRLGASPVLVGDLVENAICWPNLDKPWHIRQSDSWREEIEAGAELE
jgi:hypothetical protein